MKSKIMFTGILLTVSMCATAITPDTLTVRIKGMRCEDCAHKVMKALEKDKGVKDIKFNLERRTASIAYDPQATCTDSIESILKATGRFKPSPYSPTDVIKRGMGMRMEDMFCNNCANRIMKNLKDMPGIDSMAPHIDKHYMFIRYDANKTCKADIRKALIDLGYTAVNYYTSDKIAFAYYLVPEGACTQDNYESVMCIKGVEDAAFNPKRKSLAITYFNDETTAEELMAEVKKAGIDVTIPTAHKCKKKEGEEPKE